MPIDTSILGSYRPPQAENLFNTLTQFEAIRSAQQQRQLNALQLQKAQREQEQEQATNALLGQPGTFDPETGEINYSAVMRAAPEFGLAGKIPQYAELQIKQRKASREAQEAQFKASQEQDKAVLSRLNQIRMLNAGVQTKQGLLVSHNAVHDDPIVGPWLKQKGVDRATGAAEIEALTDEEVPAFAAKSAQALGDVIKQTAASSAIARAERAVDARRRPDRSAVGEARTRAEGANVETPDVAFANRPLDAVEYILDLAEELDRQGDADPAKAMRDQAKALMDQQRLGTTDDIREYRQAQQDGYRGSFMQYMRDVKPLSAARQTVSVGGKVYQEQTAKDTMDVIRNAPKARQALERTNSVMDLLEKGKANTGLAAQFRTDMGRAVALFSKRAPESVTDTETLQALLGADVFPLIQSLGIGARGLDTPAEREFLLNVMTGTIALDNTTLQEMTRLRAKTFEQAIEQYNTMLREGEFDDYMSETKRKLKPIQLPERRGATVKPLRQGAELQAEPLAGPTGRSADPTEVILPNGERMRFPTKKIADEYRQKFSLE